ncbi:MAG: N-acetyl-1-D-myo-inositol-2-amino-2-deoxy-alpha-D-glucopyranoside deacetylase [Nakamurella sp.]
MGHRKAHGGIVAVHAHPDDESISMGATLAFYSAMGVPVTLVTATLGEQGETMYGRLDGLTVDNSDQLGGYRLVELLRACAAMRIGDQRMLGGLGRFRDSGMVDMPGAKNPRAFIHAQRGGPLHDEAVLALTKILAEVQPRVVVTYDATGGYGHPDHIAAHHVSVAAFDRFVTTNDTNGYDAVPAARLLEVVRPRSLLAVALENLWGTTLPARYLKPTVDELGTLVSDDEYDIAISVGPWGAARRAAMSAHATQLDVWAGAVDGFALTNLKAQPLLSAEYFRVLAGASARRGSTDLMVGLSPTYIGVA